MKETAIAQAAVLHRSRTGCCSNPTKHSVVSVASRGLRLAYPYLSKAKKQLTIRLDEDTIKYFKALAEQSGIPYQNLMNLWAKAENIEFQSGTSRVSCLYYVRCWVRYRQARFTTLKIPSLPQRLARHRTPEENLSVMS